MTQTPHVQAFFDEDTFTVSYVVSDPATKRAAIIDSVLDFDPASGRTATRSADILQKHLPEVLKRAYENKGASFVEIFQNCIVYNADVFENFTGKKVADEHQLRVEHGKPLLFNKGKNGVRFNPQTFRLEVAAVGESGIPETDILIHDETNPTLAQMLLAMPQPEFPVALGVIYRAPATTFDEGFWKGHPTGGKRTGKVADALRRGGVWTKKAG